MTYRERLLAVFRGDRPDAMPWFADLSYWRAAHRAIGDLPEEYADDEGYVLKPNVNVIEEMTEMIKATRAYQANAAALEAAKEMFNVSLQI